MRIFGSDRIQGMMGRLGMEEGEPIEHGMVTQAIERAQKQVEGRNFETRKHLLEYDDVMNKQREAIYSCAATSSRGARGATTSWSSPTTSSTACSTVALPGEGRSAGLGPHRPAHRDARLLRHRRRRHRTSTSCGIDELRETLVEVDRGALRREGERGTAPRCIRGFERAIMLQVVDTAWKDHLLALDHLKEGIGLRGYGQRDPLQEYKKESFDLFEMMRERVENDIVQKLFRFEPMTEEQVVEQRIRQQRAAPRIELSAPPKVEGQRPQPGRVNRDGQGGAQRPLPLRLGEEVQEVPRGGGDAWAEASSGGDRNQGRPFGRPFRRRRT